MTAEHPRHDPAPATHTHFRYVLSPGALDPGERHERYATMLDGSGRVTGRPRTDLHPAIDLQG